MEGSNGNRLEKRQFHQEGTEDQDSGTSDLKKPRLPSLASVIIEAVKVESLQRLCSSLEPLFRRIVSEEVECALTKLSHTKLARRSSPPRIGGPEGNNLQLQFRTKMPPHLFTGGKVEGEQGAAIHVVLLDVSSGSVMQSGPESAAKLNVVVLEGDFNNEADENWTKEYFENHEVKEREGKRPLITGDLQVILKKGVGTLGDLIFTDNSSWIRSRKFRLGVKVALGYCDGIRVREAKTEAFAVKDHRGELYKKHYPPALCDEVWRLDRIAKDGALHKKLIKAKIITVADFLRVLVRDPQRLRNILGSGMSNRMWDNTVEHAKTCVLGEKLYVYYADGSHSSGVIFNDIYELLGLMADGQFLALESLTHDQKLLVDSLVKRAYDNWNQVVEYDCKVLGSLCGSEDTRTLTEPTADNNHVMDDYLTTTQSRKQYLTPESSSQCLAKSNNSLVSIEFPLIRSDLIMGLMPNSQSAALSGGMDYPTIEVPPLGDSYVSGDWSGRRNGEGLEHLFSEEIRQRSSEMLGNDDMQRLLKTFGAGGLGMGSFIGYPEEACYSYKVPYELVEDQQNRHKHGQRSGKATVGWLKLKAALRWGIFIRKKAAERRARLVELD